MTRTILLLFAQFIFISAYSQFDTSIWVTDGPVTNIEREGDNVYWTGDFTYAGPVMGGMVPVNIQTHEVIAGFPKLNGYVYKILRDQNGGWYVAGLFDIPGYPGYENFVHIKNDFSIDTAVQLAPDSSVLDMIVYGNTLYIGGTFKFINGISRTYIAAIDFTTGGLLAWNPNFTPGNGFLITRLLAANGFIYAGGKFSNIGGLVRNNLVEISIATSTATSWNPNPNTYVYTLALDSIYLYIGGSFTSIGGNSHKPIAKVDLNTHQLTSFNPITSGSQPFDAIYDIEVLENYIYVASNLDAISFARGPITKLNKSGNAVQSWDAKCKGIIYDLEINDGKIYFSSRSDSFPGLKYYGGYNFFIVDTATGALLSHDIKMSGRMNTLHSSNDTLFIAGTLCSLSGPSGPGLVRRSLFAYDVNTQIPLTLSLDINGGIYHSKILNHHLVMSGYFDTIATQYRKYFAKIDLNTGFPDNWQPSITGNVFTITTEKDNLYVLGQIIAVDSVPQQCILIFDTVSFVLKPHNLTFGGTVGSAIVRDIDFTNDRIYITGSYDSINNIPRLDVSCLNISDSTITPFEVGTHTGGVFGSKLINDKIYCFGYFSTFGDSTRENIACLDTATGKANAWKVTFPFTGGAIYSIAIINDSIISVGDHRLYNGNPYSEPLLITDTSTGVYRVWNIAGESSNYAYNLFLVDNRLFIIGINERMDGQYRNNVASWILWPDSTVSITEVFQRTNINEIVFYPNPAQNSTRIVDVDKLSFPIYVELFDINGAVKKTMKINSELESISTGNLSPGTYLINCLDFSGRRFTGKVILE